VRIPALITAIGGFRRFPGKTLLILGGNPLIAWTVDVAGGIPELSDILASTDDPTIAAASSEWRAFYQEVK
jgi:CMP-N,N'-diacetyllegionaminic acid synthase